MVSRKNNRVGPGRLPPEKYIQGSVVLSQAPASNVSNCNRLNCKNNFSESLHLFQEGDHPQGKELEVSKGSCGSALATVSPEGQNAPWWLHGLEAAARQWPPRQLIHPTKGRNSKTCCQCVTSTTGPLSFCDDHRKKYLQRKILSTMIWDTKRVTSPPKYATHLINIHKSLTKFLNSEPSMSRGRSLSHLLSAACSAELC